jgi:hypothetical protein
MLNVDYTRWTETPATLRERALSSNHPRTRERFLALYEIARGSNATRVAETLERHHQTVMEWVHRYNEHGPDALVYCRTGGRPPFRQRSMQPSMT